MEKYNKKNALVEKQKEVNDLSTQVESMGQEIDFLTPFRDDYYKEKEKYECMLASLTAFLFEKTNITYIEEKAILEALRGLMIANTEELDNVSTIDGYVKEIKRTEYLVRPTIYPEDIEVGYYKIEDGIPIVDEIRKAYLYEVL